MPILLQKGNKFNTMADTFIEAYVEKGYMPAPCVYDIFNDKLWNRINVVLSIARCSIIPFMLKNGTKCDSVFT